MKKFLFPFAAIALSLTACTPKFTINGSVEGEQTGNVFLVKYADQKWDTLAKAPITDGKFTMNGQIEGVTNAFLTIEGKRNRSIIFVENAKFTANLNPKNPMENKIEGTPIQALANDFSGISMDLRKRMNELEKEFRAAAEVKDTVKMQELQDIYRAQADIASAKEDSLFAANTNSYVAAYILLSKMSDLDLDKLIAKYETLGEQAKASDLGKQIAERIEKLTSVAVGKVAPDFTMNDPEGNAISMHSIKAKVKIIDFWASWCGPCRGENPNVVKIYQEYQPKGLEILGVSLDNDKEAWLKAIADDQLSWKHVSDLKGWGCEAGKLYVISGIPHMLVLDENNVIVAKDLRGDALKAKIAELLN